MWRTDSNKVIIHWRSCPLQSSQILFELHDQSWHVRTNAAQDHIHCTLRNASSYFYGFICSCFLGTSPYRDRSVGHSSHLLLHHSLRRDVAQGRVSSGFFCLQDVWLHSLSGAVFLVLQFELLHSSLLCWWVTKQTCQPVRILCSRSGILMFQSSNRLPKFVRRIDYHSIVSKK